MLKLALIVSTALLSTSAIAHSKVYVATDNSMETKVCLTAAEGSVLQMNKVARQIRPDKHSANGYKVIANKLTCNGLNVGDWAMQAGNQPVARKVNSYRSTQVTITDVAQNVKTEQTMPY